MIGVKRLNSIGLSSWSFLPGLLVNQRLQVLLKVLTRRLTESVSSQHRGLLSCYWSSSFYTVNPTGGWSIDFTQSYVISNGIARETGRSIHFLKNPKILTEITLKDLASARVFLTIHVGISVFWAVACSLRATATVSSCPPLASVGLASSTTLAAAATTGRVRSIPRTRTTRGTSSSFRTTTTWTATAAGSTVNLSVQCVPHPRTNPCSVPTGRVKKSWRAGCARECATQPRPATFSCVGSFF